MAYDQEVVASNPGTVYWMDVSHDATSFYIKRKKMKIKEAKWGIPKKTTLFKNYQDNW